MPDIIDQVNLTAAAFAAWSDHARRAMEELVAAGRRPSGPIPDERAEEGPDGALVIYVDVPGVARVEMAVPRGQWAWRDRN